MSIPSADLQASLVRALWGNVYPQLRAASIEQDAAHTLITLRFEYDGEPGEPAREACECAATEVVSDFWQGHQFQFEHIARPVGQAVNPLKVLVYRRGEPATSPTQAPPRYQHIGQIALVVEDYDAAIRFYVDTLGFSLVEDTYIPEQDKRWVIVCPPGANESRLLLAKGVGEQQRSRIGNQTGGRVFLFLFTNNFWRDYRDYQSKGVVFVREPTVHAYGTVAVFQDLYGNLWDLLEPSTPP